VDGKGRNARGVAWARLCAAGGDGRSDHQQRREGQ
jgi:hypothetical protein